MKNIDDEIIYSILQDDLPRFKQIHLCSIDVNHPLKPHEYLKPVNPKISSNTNSKNSNSRDNKTFTSSIQYKPIKGPTALIFAILCERPLFCKYILDRANPDLSIRVNGWTAFHFACCTNDTKCLSILLHSEYIQQNLNVPIIAPSYGNPRDFKQTTTAIHLAVSNRLYKTVLTLLFKPLPDLNKDIQKIASNKVSQNFNSNKVSQNCTSNKDSENSNSNKVSENSASNKDSENSSKNANSNKSSENSASSEYSDDFDDSTASYEVINVNMRGTSGSTPLHIALFNKDFEMCQILINAGSDASIRNNDNVDCISYARRLELPAKFVRLLSGESEPETTAAIIGRHFSGSELRHFYDYERCEDEEEEEELEIRVGENRRSIEELKSAMLKKANDNTMVKCELLKLKEETKKLTEKPVFVERDDRKCCCVCTASPAKRCNLCGKYFCETCFRKRCHECFG